jgi:leader peptidase (prepilin peptidase)/N-methyltransferase
MWVSRGIDAALAGVLGLLVGSFLNVVIYRLPKIMERQWAAECAELSGQPVPETEPFNLMRPRSRCRQCGHVLRWYENVPVLSYLALRGKCSSCSAPIGLRYPLVESVTGALFAWCVWHWGLIPGAGAWCLFSAAIVALALIDMDTQILPDDLNYTLLWLGLLASALGWTVPLDSSVWAPLWATASSG